MTNNTRGDKLTRPVIAVDIDDTIADLTGRMVSYSNKAWRCSITRDDYNEDWSQMWGGVDLDEVLRRADEIFSHPNIYPELEMLYGAKEALIELKKRFKIVALTSRRSELADLTRRWLRKNLPNIIEEVHFSGNWDNINENSKNLHKGEVAERLGVDYLIDDQPKHVNGAAKAGIQALLFGDYPWNNGVNVHQDVVRVKDWQEVLDFFNRQGSTQSFSLRKNS